MNFSKRGFSLIEILVVVVIIGAISVLVLVALNPAQRMASIRDQSRINGVRAIGSALDAYATARGSYPTYATTWLQQLVDSGDLTKIPDKVNYDSGYTICVRYPINETWCSHVRVLPPCAVVYSRLESAKYNAKCTSPNLPFFTYSTADGRAGLLCRALGSEPVTLANCAGWGASLLRI